MSQDSPVITAVRRRIDLQNRIRELGGTVPKPWGHDDGSDPEIRNLQLLETVEELEAEQGLRAK